VNFHELPINAPLPAVHKNQRDGMHRRSIPRGRVAYEPNSLGGGCPFQAGARGFVSFPEPVAEDKMRGKPEKFADHFPRATLLFASQRVGGCRRLAAGDKRAPKDAAAAFMRALARHKHCEREADPSPV
jgi:catalase